LAAGTLGIIQSRHLLNIGSPPFGKIILFWLITEASSAAPAGDPLFTDQKKQQPTASTPNEQPRLNREYLVISDMHNRLAFLLLIPLRQG
jgi:hypothetical protein